MFKTKNALPEAARVKVVELLNARLADCTDLQTQTNLSLVRPGFKRLSSPRVARLRWGPRDGERSWAGLDFSIPVFYRLS
jgi:hypothetical protein